MRLHRPHARQPVEILERRLLLSAASHPNSDGLSAAQLSTLHAAASSALRQTDPMSLVSTDLAQVYAELTAGDPVTFGSIQTSNGDPGVIVRTRGGVAGLAAELDHLGIDILGINRRSHFVDGYLPLAALSEAAALPGLRSISAVYKPVVYSVGSAVDQADSALNASLARSLYGLTGAGIKIGVISDSVNQVSPGLAGSVASGDLPNNVQVLQDGEPGDTDEGRAILEELHDMAPGASLAFYSGDGDQDSMVTAIKSLQGAGCKIIVDDLGYYGEPMFQDGVISQAITQYVAQGNSYFSAIGNDGNSGYLKTNLQYTTNTDHTTWVNFAGNGAASGETMNFTVSGPVDLTLEWDNPYNGDTGNATANLNIYIYSSNGKSLVDSSTDNNLSDGIPLQALNTLQAGNYQMKIQLAGVAHGATPPDMLKFVASEEAAGGLSTVQYPGIMSSAWGHGAGQNTISVGAVPFFNAPPFSSVTPIQSEPYSSTGPIIYEFDAYGNRLSQPLVLDKPDVSGIDGANTSFFGYRTSSDPTSLPQFYGTSAAAPNVAAIAALIDQYHPGATQAKILSALESSATPLNGTPAGRWDAQGGYGLVNAVKALQYFGAPAPVVPTAQFAAVTTPRTTSLATESIYFNEKVTGLDLADFTLTRNGGANLLTAAQTLTTSNSITFTLDNLGALTSIAGSYVLTLKGSGAGITGDGMPMTAGSSVSWKNAAAPAHATVAAVHLFYNGSGYDGYSDAASAADDKAIATDKSPLLPGKTAAFANYSSYNRGLNGIMIDVSGLAAASLSAADFTFKTGNTAATSSWATAPNPSTILIRPGAGAGGSTRIELVWPDYSPTNAASAIAKKWLQVTVKADSATGLASPYVFYFGNAIGATGISATSAAVTAADVSAIDGHRGSGSITNVWDVTRNGLINYDDGTVAAQNETSGASALQLITPH
ncbi:MAG TPA: S8 family serine peptidase [Tepidisphaeraceae bacterium]|nr:S8 family serine peptidase [Tepidisphaeraceae bacterium]